MSRIERGWNGDDGADRRHRDIVRVDDDAVVSLCDRAHGCVQAHRVSQLVGNPLRDRSGAAVDHVLLRPAFDGEQRIDASVGMDEEQHVEQRHVVQVAREQAAHRHLEQVAADGGADARMLEPGCNRPGVPFRSALGRPRRLDRDVPGHAIELRLRQGERHDGKRADLRDEPGITTRASTVDEKVRALHPGLVRRDAELSSQAENSRRAPARATRRLGRPVSRRTDIASICDRRRGHAPRARPPICHRDASDGRRSGRRIRRRPRTRPHRSARACGPHRTWGDGNRDHFGCLDSRLGS